MVKTESEWFAYFLEERIAGKDFKTSVEEVFKCLTFRPRECHTYHDGHLIARDIASAVEFLASHYGALADRPGTTYPGCHGEIPEPAHKEKKDYLAREVLSASYSLAGYARVYSLYYPDSDHKIRLGGAITRMIGDLALDEEMFKPSVYGGTTIGTLETSLLALLASDSEFSPGCDRKYFESVIKPYYGSLPTFGPKSRSTLKTHPKVWGKEYPILRELDPCFGELKED